MLFAITATTLRFLLYTAILINIFDIIDIIHIEYMFPYFFHKVYFLHRHFAAID